MAEPRGATARRLFALRLAELRLALMLFTRLPLGRSGEAAPAGSAPGSAAAPGRACPGAPPQPPAQNHADTPLAQAFPAAPPKLPALGAALWAFPLAGAVAAVLPAGVFALAHGAVPPFMAAALALAAGLAVTGALHEDGLADTADGFGGGRTRARKLEIMRDSRIGSYGVLALGVALLLRAAGLAAAPDAAAGALAIVAVGAASRAALPLAMRILPPARAEGVAAEAGALPAGGVAAALLIGAVALLPLPGTALLIAGLGGTVLGVILLARRQIGGITGDVLGALQQASEIALWVVLAALW